LASVIGGADIVAAYRAIYTTVYRLDSFGLNTVSRRAPAALAG